MSDLVLSVSLNLSGMRHAFVTNALPVLNVASGVAAVVLTKEVTGQLLQSMRDADLRSTSRDFVIYFVTIYGQVKILQYFAKRAMRFWTPSTATGPWVPPTDGPSNAPAQKNAAPEFDDPVKPSARSSTTEQKSNTETLEEAASSITSPATEPGSDYEVVGNVEGETHQ